jgi:hypothetical protein
MFRAPGALPTFSLLLDDLPVGHDAVCKHLDISAATLRRYVLADHAPRPVLLSLFWETRWGRSAADCEAANAASVHAQHARALRQQNVRLHHVIDQLEKERSNGAANSPFFRVG